MKMSTSAQGPLVAGNQFRRLLCLVGICLAFLTLSISARAQSEPVPANYFSMGVNTFANINCNVITPVTNCSTTYAFPTFSNNGATTNMFYGYRLWDQYCANCPGGGSLPNVGVWAAMETARGTFQFGGLDDILNIANSRGLDVLSDLLPAERLIG